MPRGEPFQPVVTYDGRIITKPVEYDEEGKVVPDPSWVAFMKDYRDGKIPERFTNNEKEGETPQSGAIPQEASPGGGHSVVP